MYTMQPRRGLTTRNMVTVLRRLSQSTVIRYLGGFSVFVIYTITVCIVNNPKSSYFLPSLEPNKKRELKTLAAFLFKTFDDHNIEYFMVGGTLIGSYRHHDLLPWDDDLDIMVNISQKKQVYDVLTTKQPEYKLWMEDHDYNTIYFWKFYSSTGDHVPRREIKWPFIDMFFFDSNITHLWISDPRYSKLDCYPRSLVYPLRKRPVGSLMINAPCDVNRFLSTKWGDLSICVTRHYNHRLEMPILFIGGQRIPCHQLNSFTPLVNRSVNNDVTTEELILAGEVISTKTFPVLSCERK